MLVPKREDALRNRRSNDSLFATIDPPQNLRPKLAKISGMSSVSGNANKCLERRFEGAIACECCDGLLNQQDGRFLTGCFDEGRKASAAYHEWSLVERTKLWARRVRINNRSAFCKPDEKLLSSYKLTRHRMRLSTMFRGKITLRQGIHSTQQWGRRCTNKLLVVKVRSYNTIRRLGWVECNSQLFT